MQRAEVHPAHVGVRGVRRVHDVDLETPDAMTILSTPGCRPRETLPVYYEYATKGRVFTESTLLVVERRGDVRRVITIVAPNTEVTPDIADGFPDPHWTVHDRHVFQILCNLGRIAARIRVDTLTLACLRVARPELGEALVAAWRLGASPSILRKILHHVEIPENWYAAKKLPGY